MNSLEGKVTSKHFLQLEGFQGSKILRKDSKSLILGFDGGGTGVLMSLLWSPTRALCSPALHRTLGLPYLHAFENLNRGIRQRSPLRLLSSSVKGCAAASRARAGGLRFART